MAFQDDAFQSDGGGGSSPTFPALAVATTRKLIRDRMIDVVEGLIPALYAGDRFRAYRNEDLADFIKYAEANAGSSFREFQIRDTGEKLQPEVSNTDIAEMRITLTIIVAYPQNARTGDNEALDRDDAYNSDLDLIDLATGLFGRANFQPPNPDACWRESLIPERLYRNGVDFLVITHTLSFQQQFA